MADAYTDFLNLTKPEVGASRDAWGDKWNANANAIDLWAKATDKLAKDALPMTAIKKDAQNVTQPWTVAGPVNYGDAVGVAGALSVTGAASFAGAFSLAAKKTATFGSTVLGESFDASNVPTSTDLKLNVGNTFRIFNAAGDAALFTLTDGALKVKTNTVWHAGNLNPPDYANRTTTATQSFVGNIEIARSDAPPVFDLTYTGKNRMRQTVDANGAWVLQTNATTPDSVAYVTTAGALWLKGINTDVATRIEDRAKFYADDRLATARAEYGQAYQKTGGTIAGDVNIAKASGQPVLDMVMPGVLRSRQTVDGSGNVLWQNGDNGDNRMYITGAGDLWLKALGTTVNTQFGNQYSDYMNRLNVKSGRLVLLGDVSVGASANGVWYNSAGPGSVVTGFLSNNSSGYPTHFRYRQIQFTDRDGNWYAIATAS